MLHSMPYFSMVSVFSQPVPAAIAAWAVLGGVAQATQAQAPITQVSAAGFTPAMAPPYTRGSEMLYIKVTVTVFEAKLVMITVASATNSTNTAGAYRQ